MIYTYKYTIYMFKDYKCIHKLSKNTKHGMKTIQLTIAADSENDSQMQ